jgi:hypothetical protein
MPMTWKSMRPMARAPGVMHLLSIYACGLVVSLLAQAAAGQTVADDAHEALFAEARYPSATVCASCHPGHYREWSVSAHAYAQLSPVFNAMHGTILRRTNGTNGDFCIRCHTPVGMSLGEPEFASNLDRHPTSREGVTCIVCHRVSRAYGKISGRLAIEEGDIFAPVYGPVGGEELQRAIDSAQFGLNPEPGRTGRDVHAQAQAFFQLTVPAQCGACHDVNLVNGFRLEEAFSEYKTSPAASRGATCQACHMGREPGIDAGYDEAPAAVVGGVPTQRRRRTNHMFAGPDYSVIHPGIFPHNVAAQALATMHEWLQFDVAAGWGTDEFEQGQKTDASFPDRWRTADDRYEARSIIENNVALLEELREQRLALLRAGYRLGEIDVTSSGPRRLSFSVTVANGTDGHNVPTGFDAERLVWLHVVVSDASNRIVFESGDLDPNGDVRDTHSVYVHNGELPLDRQLFSLQSRFLTRMLRGGEREQVLAVNYSPDPLPFVRPSTSSAILTGRPVGARKHRQTLAPGREIDADYEVDRNALRDANGALTITVRLKAAMVPVNLVHEIQDVGFDYSMSPRSIADGVVAGHLVLWERTTTLPDPHRP